MSTIIEMRKNPGCLLQLLWFFFVGWWLGELWTSVAWFFMASIVGIPVGIWMLNRIPKVIALREAPVELKVSARGDGQVVKQVYERPQVPFLLRALYFILVGWWFSFLWLQAAYFLCLTVIGLPLGFWMYDRVSAVLTLKR